MCSDRSRRSSGARPRRVPHHCKRTRRRRPQRQLPLRTGAENPALPTVHMLCARICVCACACGCGSVRLRLALSVVMCARPRAPFSSFHLSVGRFFGRLKIVFALCLFRMVECIGQDVGWMVWCSDIQTQFKMQGMRHQLFSCACCTTVEGTPVHAPCVHKLYLCPLL